MSTTTTTGAPSITSWKIDPIHTHVEFAVRHLMISTVKGRFTDVEGTVELNEAHPSQSRADITIAAATVDTREPQRDAHLRSARFSRIRGVPDDHVPQLADQRPYGRGFHPHWRSDHPGRDPRSLARRHGRGTWQGPWGGERAGFSAKTKIKRSDFGLTWNQVLEAGGIAVGDEVKISLEVEVIKQ